jgi:phosphatidylinositol-3-phosphatase
MMQLSPRAAVCTALLAALSLTSACGGRSNTSSIPPLSSSRVFLLVEENHSYSEVIGNSSMPYLNSLATQYGLATQYFADSHPSIGNYFMLTTGKIETNDDAFTGTISDDNIVRELVKANKSWRSYAESLPNPGYTGGDAYPYLQHHNPFTYFTDVVGTSQAANLVPFSQFPSDLSAGTLADFSFIVPNALDDAHDGTLGAADQWLRKNIDPLVKSSAFESNGLLVIVFDESDTSDTAHGGGHVAAILVGPKVKSGFQNSTSYQHESTLRLVLSTLGVDSFPGNAASAPEMGVFFR